MEGPAIAIDRFSKRFGAVQAVQELTLAVPRGSIFGLLGQNGAGKTTTITTLLNLQQPTSGTLRVLGLDSVRDSVEIRRRVGYLPEEPCQYGWMTVDEILRFNAAFFPAWDRALVDRLVAQLGLPRERRLRALSRGMQAKVGLVLALGPRPEMLILDDPTSGLDPIVRQEFLEVVIANVQAEGGTVFFSTHLLHEMERVADHVAIMHGGRLCLQSPLDALKASRKQLRAVYPHEVPERFPVEGVLRVQRHAHEAVLTVIDYQDALVAQLRAGGAESVEVQDLALEEIFVETIKGAALAPEVTLV